MAPFPLGIPTGVMRAIMIGKFLSGVRDKLRLRTPRS